MTGRSFSRADATSAGRSPFASAVIVTAGFTLIAWLGWTEAAVARPPVPESAMHDSIVRAVVAEEAKLQLTAEGRFHEVEQVTANQVLLADVERLSDGWLVRATLPIVHWPPYLLLRNGDRYRPLGGFTSPDLSELRLADCVAIKDDVGRGIACGRALARLLDPNGAALVAFRTGDIVRDLNERSLRHRWSEESRSGQVQPDTIIAISEGLAIVRVLALSERAHHVFAGDLPIEYAFVVRADGAVLRWAQLLGAAF